MNIKPSAALGAVMACIAVAAAQAQPARDTPTSSAAAWPSRSLPVFQGAAPVSPRSAGVRAGGYTVTLELTPLLVAADRFGSAGGKVVNAAIPALLSGQLDVVTNAETQLLRQSVQRPDMRIIMTVAEGRYRIVARRSAGIQTLADLKGKKIGTLKDSSSAYYLHKMLQGVGLTENDVSIVSIFPLEKIPDALRNGEVDAVTIWEPEVEVARQAIGADAVEFQDPKAYRELFNLNTTAGHLADGEKRSQIVAYVRDLIRASRDLSSDPAPGQRLAAQASGYSLSLVQASWDHLNFPGGLAPNLLDVLVDEESWLSSREGRTPRSRETLAQLIDASVVAEALRDLR